MEEWVRRIWTKEDNKVQHQMWKQVEKQKKNLCKKLEELKKHLQDPTNVTENQAMSLLDQTIMAL